MDNETFIEKALDNEKLKKSLHRKSFNSYCLSDLCICMSKYVSLYNFIFLSMLAMARMTQGKIRWVFQFLPTRSVGKHLSVQSLPRYCKSIVTIMPALNNLVTGYELVCWSDLTSMDEIWNSIFSIVVNVQFYFEGTVLFL